MKPSPFEVFTFRSVGEAVARALDVEPAPECRVVHGRVTLTFRRLGAARWPEPQQMELALRAVAAARVVLAGDSRWQLRRGATKAVVVVFEDSTVVQGCAVTARWESAVPSQR
jgi:hypothetical protein